MPAFGGHGIGTYFHGPPDIIHTGNWKNVSVLSNFILFLL